MRITSKTAGWAVFVLAAVYYFFNRYPGLGFIDSGELALSAYTLGVPHPTGYPLYLIISAPASHIFSRPITGVTILGGVIAALACMVFFHLTDTFRRRYFPEVDRHHIISMAGALILCLAPLVAEQGVTNEVYALALLINLTVIYVAARLMMAENKSEVTRLLILLWYLAGLSLTDHMSSVQLIPALIVVSVMMMRRIFSWKLPIIIAVAFAIPLTVYGVLPIRAAADPAPIANWGDVTTWDNFIRHVSGWQFRVWMFGGQWSEIWGNFKNFTSILYDQFPLLVLPLIALGAVCVYRKMWKLLLVLGMIMAVNIWLGINYSIPDIESYYLTTIASLMLLAVTGIMYVGSLMRARYVIPAVTILLLVWQGIRVWDENYKRDYTLPEDYALNIGRSADSGAVVMSEIWDHHDQAFYLQQAEGIRPDLKFIDKELLRRSWYYKIIHRVYPELYAKIADLAPPFLDAVRVFESGGNFNPQTLEYYYQAIINRLLTECGPAYIDFRLDYKPRGDQYLRPQGILYKVDTLRIDTPLVQPRLIWRGRSLDQYDDWRARDNVDMIKTMASYW